MTVTSTLYGWNSWQRADVRPFFKGHELAVAKNSQIFGDDEDADEAIVSQEYDRETLLPLMETALRRKIEKAQANVNYNNYIAGIVLDDWIMPLDDKKKRRFDPVCEQILAGKSGQYHPFSRVLFIGISQKYIFDSWNRRL